jgi:predicted transcriptional regulator
MKPGDTKELVYNAENTKETYVGYQTSILGVEENTSIKDQHRIKHCLTTGENGTGKSIELLHVALQDTVKGHGLALFNPKGKLIDRYLARIPENRLDDLIYVNPVTQPITGINVLEPYVNRDSPVAVKTNQIELIVSNLIQLFKRQSDNWGDRFGRVLATLLRAGIEANIEYQAGYTLLDIKHCVTDNSKIEELIDDTSDPEYRRQLAQIKDNLSDSQLEPLVRRLNDFTENKTVRHVIAAENSDIDFREVINQNKILLVDVRSGEVGNTVTELLTSIVITKLWAAAQTRYYQEQEVEPFYLFIDELQSFPMEGAQFEEILSKAREYRLGCWLATQYLAQLPREMRDAVQNNCRTKLVFDPSGSDDLSKLNRMLRSTDQKQLNALGDFRAILQTPGTHQRKKAEVIDTFPPWNTDNVDLDYLKNMASPATGTPQQPVFVGKGTNSGGKKHNELLTKAENELEERGLQVKTLYQDSGDDKTDGEVQLPDGSIANLEVEHGTLSKPAKVLENLRRAAEQDRETIFIVEQDKARKLHNILSDPVNRLEDQHSDEHGKFSYYREDREPITELDWMEKAKYRILESSEDGLQLYDDTGDQDKQEQFNELRDIDKTVLNCIKDGKDDVQKITSATGLPNHIVNYSFKKLEENRFIQVEKTEKPVERVINGQKRVFQVKIAELTSEAERQV